MSLLPARNNFTIWSGATFRTRLTVYSDDGVTLWDLTGYTADLSIKDQPNGSVLYSMTTTNGGITLGGVNGTIDLLISATTTGGLTWKTGVYDLTITAGGGGDTSPLLYGGFGVNGI